MTVHRNKFISCNDFRVGVPGLALLHSIHVRQMPDTFHHVWRDAKNVPQQVRSLCNPKADFAYSSRRKIIVQTLEFTVLSISLGALGVHRSTALWFFIPMPSLCCIMAAPGVETLHARSVRTAEARRKDSAADRHRSIRAHEGFARARTTGL